MKKPMLAMAAVLLTSGLLLSGCSGNFVWSGEAQEQANSVVCSSMQVLVEQIKTGGAVARTGAVVIRDNSTDERTRELAQKIIDGDADEAVYTELAGLLQEQCA